MVRLSRIAGLAAVMVFFMAPYKSTTQHLNSARGIALGGFTSLSSGISAVDWNPASLVYVKDWEFHTSNYLPLHSETFGFTLQSVDIAKRFFSDHAAALRYAPGKLMEFVIPQIVTFVDSTVAVRTTFDQKISYQEPYAFGYAHRFNEEISVGFTTRFIEEKVSDTKYFLDSNFTIRSRTVDFRGTSLTVDIGMMWNPIADWKFGTVVKNLLKISESQLPDEVAQYRLDLPRFFRLGVGYTGARDLLIGFDGDTEKRFRLGVEWIALNAISARSGMYFDANSRPSMEAFAFGVGVQYEVVEFDASYLKFLSQTNRKGAAQLNAFTASSIGDVEYNPYTGDRLAFTLTFHFGRMRESMIQIEHIEISSDIYPALSRLYSYTPVGNVRVRNTTDKPIEATVSFYLERLMDAPTESRSVMIPPAEHLEIPLYAIFNENVRSVVSTAVREGNVYVRTRSAEDVDDRRQTHILVHGRNDWNGDVTLLQYFTTPDESEVLQFTRTVLGSYKDRIDTTSEPIRDFVRAKILFDEFARRLTYVHDPKKSQDVVQYPSETLSLRGGDCDDLTVCYSTLLASIGIATAFIDVVPPEKPSDAHIYMMFDSGIEVRHANLLSDNPKRYIIRKNTKGNETLWVPVETTVITKGFEEAWDVGAREYLGDGEMNLGLLKGWMRVVDVQIGF